MHPAQNRGRPTGGADWSMESLENLNGATVLPRAAPRLRESHSASGRPTLGRSLCACYPPMGRARRSSCGPASTSSRPDRDKTPGKRWSRRSPATAITMWSMAGKYPIRSPACCRRVFTARRRSSIRCNSSGPIPSGAVCRFPTMSSTSFTLAPSRPRELSTGPSKSWICSSSSA